MRALLTTLVLVFTFQAQAMDVNIDQMTDDQKIQLIQVLNQLEPEVLSSVLTEEALDWYIEQFNRGGFEDEVNPANIEVSTGAVEGIGGFNDPNAPKFL